MNQVRINIEKAKDHFYAFSENVEGVTGIGNNAKEAKKSALEAINILINENAPEFVPPILRGEYQIVWKLDTQSLLSLYKGILSNTGLEKITGINSKLINHYATGIKKPRPDQKKKIQKAVHILGAELSSIEL